MTDTSTKKKIPSSFKKDDLKVLSKISRDSNKLRLIDKELNAIKLLVLQQNNLGFTKYNYIYNYDSSNLVMYSDDYFNDVLQSLIDMFPDSIISYTTSISELSTSIMYDIKTTYKNDTNQPVTNTIIIDWS